MRDVLIVGAGPSGLISGYLLVTNGLNVTLIEKEGEIGGLLRTVNIDGVEIEAVYHHILLNDRSLLDLLKMLRIDRRIIWNRSRISLYTHKKFYNITTPFDYLSLDFLTLQERITLIRRLALPDVDAESLEEFFGEKVFRSFIEDMLINKFGEYAHRIHPHWFINKIKKRGRSRLCLYERLGYLEGSFKGFVEKVAEEIQKRGSRILLNSHLKSVVKRGTRFLTKIGDREYEFDYIIFTISPYIIADLLKDLSARFSSNLRRLEYMSNITMLLYTKKNITRYYWINIADRDTGLTGIISQSNLISYKDLKGYFTYVSRYLSKEDNLLFKDDNFIKDYIIEELHKMGIDLLSNDIIDYHISRVEYAQPLYFSEDDLLLSDLTTPIEGIFILNNHSILPEDRGLDNIVKKAKRLSNILIR